MTTPTEPRERASMLRWIVENGHNTQEQVDAMVFTCDRCTYADKCEFAFDPYNTDGDCLDSK